MTATAHVTFCDAVPAAGSPITAWRSRFEGPPRVGVLPVARCAREGTLPHLTQRNRGEMSSKRASNRRQRHLPLIAAETDPWRKYWRAACFLMSELHALHRKDPQRAREVADNLTSQTQRFAETLNAEAQEARS